MPEPKYEHLSFARHNGDVLLITTLEQKSEAPKWYQLSGSKTTWTYSGKIVDTSNPNCPRFVGKREDIPEEELSPLERSPKRGKFPQENIAIRL